MRRVAFIVAILGCCIIGSVIGTGVALGLWYLLHR